MDLDDTYQIMRLDDFHSFKVEKFSDAGETVWQVEVSESDPARTVKSVSRQSLACAILSLFITIQKNPNK